MDHSLLSPDRIATILAHAMLVPPGSFAEVGICAGGMLAELARLHPERRCLGYDTFTGLPDVNRANYEQFAVGEFSVPRSEVEQFLSPFPNIELREGLFPSTGQESDGPFALVHLDIDYGLATLEALRWLWPRMVPGGVVVLDDFDWHLCPGIGPTVRAWAVHENVLIHGGAEWQAVLIKE